MLYDSQTPGGAKLAVAIAKVKEGLAEIQGLKDSTLAKAYADRPGGNGEPVFTRMIEEYGVVDAATGQGLFTKMDSIVLAFGTEAAQAGAAREALLLTDKFA